MLWENNNPEPVPNELGRKYEFSTLAKPDGTPHDHLAKQLPAVLAAVIEGVLTARGARMSVFSHGQNDSIYLIGL